MKAIVSFVAAILHALVLGLIFGNPDMSTLQAILLVINGMSLVANVAIVLDRNKEEA